MVSGTRLAVSELLQMPVKSCKKKSIPFSHELPFNGYPKWVAIFFGHLTRNL
jgi:hypothetical protein